MKRIRNPYVGHGCKDCGGRVDSAQTIRCRTCYNISRGTPPKCLDCDKRLSNWGKYSLCIGCLQSKNVGNKRENPAGYVLVYQGRDKLYKMEHRLVMEQILGRELVKNENVHHINGVRNDNRPENLELWIKSQPPGMRAEDAIEWFTAELRRLAPERLVD